jgi:hypothetical protein
MTSAADEKTCSVCWLIDLFAAIFCLFPLVAKLAASAFVCLKCLQLLDL